MVGSSTEQFPNLVGVVLAGGRSTRMGRDKANIQYHDTPHWKYLHKLLSLTCGEVYLSCRRDQTHLISSGSNCILDQVKDLGPMGALTSAFHYDSSTAKLVVAVDMPFVQRETLQLLIKARDPSRVATAFREPQLKQAHPLLTIWEPKSKPYLDQALKTGQLSPRELLNKMDVLLIDPPDVQVLRSVDSIDDYKKALKELGS